MAEVINAWRKTTKAWGCLIQFKAKHGSLFGSTYRDSHLLQLEGRARNITLSGMELRRVSSQWRQVCSAKTSETWNGNIWLDSEKLEPLNSQELPSPRKLPVLLSLRRPAFLFLKTEEIHLRQLLCKETPIFLQTYLPTSHYHQTTARVRSQYFPGRVM